MSDVLMTAWAWLRDALAWAAGHHLALPVLIVGTLLGGLASLPRRRRPKAGDWRKGQVLLGEEIRLQHAAFEREGMDPHNWVRRSFQRALNILRRNEVLRPSLLLAIKGKTGQALAQLERLAEDEDVRRELIIGPGAGAASGLNARQAIFLGAAAIAFLRDDPTGLTFCRRAQSVGPPLLDILHPLGFLLLKGGSRSEAADMFEQAVALHQAAAPRLREITKATTGYASTDAYADERDNEQGLAQALAGLAAARDAGR